MPSERLVITGIETRTTGVDGGHYYLKGRAMLVERGETDVYLFGDALEQEESLRSYADAASLTIVCERVDFVKGIGAYPKCWRIVENSERIRTS